MPAIIEEAFRPYVDLAAVNEEVRLIFGEEWVGAEAKMGVILLQLCRRVKALENTLQQTHHAPLLEKEKHDR